MTGTYVLLEDGRRFDGEAGSTPGAALGEVVFTTGMTGYQESLTDPSFAGQILTFTAPMIGNYGVAGRRRRVRRRAGARAHLPRGPQRAAAGPRRG